MNRNCDYWRDLLPEYLDGELRARDAVECRRHLAACPSCRRELERWQKLFAILNLAEEDPGPALTGSIMSALEEKKPGWGRSAGIPGLVAGLVLALFVVVLGWYWAGMPLPAVPRTVEAVMRVLVDFGTAFIPERFVQNGFQEVAGRMQVWVAVAGRGFWFFWVLGETLWVLASSLPAGVWLAMSAFGLAASLLLRRTLRSGTR